MKKNKKGGDTSPAGAHEVLIYMDKKTQLIC
jgi:hypothetical protein